MEHTFVTQTTETLPTEELQTIASIQSEQKGHVDGELARHEETQRQMKEELETYMGGLIQREIIPRLPTSQQQLQQPQSEFLIRCMRDGKFVEAASADPRLMDELKKIQELDIRLAQKTKEFKERAKKADKKDSDQVEVETEEEDIEEGEMEEENQQITPFGIADHRIEQIDKKLKELETSGAHLLLPPSTIIEERSASELDRKLSELQRTNDSISKKKAEPNDSATMMKQLNEICRSVAEARWNSDHISSENPDSILQSDVETRTSEIVASVLERVQTAIKEESKKQHTTATTTATIGNEDEENNIEYNEEKQTPESSDNGDLDIPETSSLETPQPQLQFPAIQKQHQTTTMTRPQSMPAQPIYQQREQSANQGELGILPKLPAAALERVQTAGTNNRQQYTAPSSAPTTSRTFSPLTRPLTGLPPALPHNR